MPTKSITAPRPHAQAGSEPRRRRARGPWARDALVLIVLLALLPFVQSSFGLQATGGYLALAMLALSLDLLWGYGGIISLGQGAFFGVGGYAVAAVLARVDGALGVVVALAAGVVIPAALAYVLGRFLFTKRPTSLFFVAMFTLALASILQQVVFKLPGLTGGHNGLIVQHTFMPVGTVASYYVMLVAFGATLLATVWLVRSDFGRHLAGARQSDERLRFLGGSTRRIHTWVFTLAGAIAGLAGAMYTPYTRLVSPDDLAFTFSAQVLVWVAVGGRRTLLGPALGALVLNIVTGELGSNLVFYWQMILGILFVLVVRFTPDGLYPVLRRLLAPLRERSPTVVETAGRGDGASGCGLETDGIAVRFGSLEVLRGATLKIAPGELRCLIGPNGAGKTTLINVLSGRQAASGGSAAAGPTALLGRTADEIAAIGVQRTFQAATVFDGLSVGENLFLAADASSLSLRSLTRRSATIELPAPARALLEESGLLARCDEEVDALGHGSRKWLELGMVLARDPQILLLDEPTAGLTAAERAAVGRLLVEQRARGLTVVIVEHDFGFVREIADSVTVLHQGRVLAEGTVDEVSADPAVRRVYLGESA